MGILLLGVTAHGGDHGGGRRDVAAPAISFHAKGKNGVGKTSIIAVGQELSVRLEGLPKNARVTLTASTGNCRSVTTFVADEHGRVDTAKQSPAAKEYDGPHPDGIFYSMSCEGKVDFDALPDVAFSAEVSGKVVAKATLERRWTPPGVEAIPVTEEGLVGVLFKPKGPGPFRTVLMLGGSEGGIPRDHAAYLASQGYAALALGYFGEKKLPPHLKQIPLEYFGKAIEWMKARPDLDTRRLAVVGCSRGGELALLLGSKYPEIRAVVALVPSGVVLKAPPPHPETAAWTLGGKDIPPLETKARIEDYERKLQFPGGVEALDYSGYYPEALKDKPAVEKSSIEVERTRGPVLLIAGDDDRMWASDPLSRVAWERLRAAKRPPGDELHSVRGGGHSVCELPGYSTRKPYVFIPGEKVFIAAGGNMESNGKGQREMVRRLDAFLEKYTKAAD